MKLIIALALAATSTVALAAQERFTVMTVSGKNVGHVWADTNGATTTIDYDVKNNGRGPTFKETLTVDAQGLPTHWVTAGTTTFGSKVGETFDRRGKRASWTDSTGKGQSAKPGIYVAQNGSPYSNAVYARALLKRPDGKFAALPGGELTLEKGEALTLNGKGGPIETNVYAVGGISQAPSMILLDAQGNLVAAISTYANTIREGYEGENERLTKLAERLSNERLARIQKEGAHRWAAPIRITNVRVFDPVAEGLSDPKDVIVSGRRIAAVLPAGSKATPGEVTIDGAGGTLVAGMADMHGHIGADDALVNVLAGVTTVRDMGNDNEVLAGLIGRIEAGEVAGPRILRTGFIEGKSPYSSNNGFVVDSEAKALEAVRWYAARDFIAIKIYNSIDPKWVPAMVKEAHRLGLRVQGHIPAFTNADAMIDAGYDELTHLNQLALGWVIKPTEDTRTLFRITAQQRLPGLDLNSAPVKATFARLKDKGIGLDDTFVIHEWLFKSRNGQPQPWAVDVIDHLPVGDQRDARQAVTDLATIGGEANALATYARLTEIMKMLKDNGTPLFPGTDMGGSFTYHHELELYQTLGFTPAQILRRATLDMQKYMGRDQSLGSVEKGKLADFFLVPGDPTKDLKAIKHIAMVVNDGAVYFPSEVYPKIGIRPFADAPRVTQPRAVAANEVPHGADIENGAHFD
ncbi:MAG TPA: amidohydrolase family protein [Sphingomonas sp.]|nr:amidohydrolase family protein [Sphingomonas sp.]